MQERSLKVLGEEYERTAMLVMKRFVKCLFELLTQHRLFFPR